MTDITRVGGKLWLLLLIPLAASSAVTGEWRVTLLRGSAEVQPYSAGATEAAAWAACQARIPQAETTQRKYTCQSPRYVATVTPSPAPVVCAVSAWSAWTLNGEWSACSAGQQTRVESRLRTVTTPPSSGGAVCPVLAESRSVSQACAVVIPPVAGTHGALIGPMRPFNVNNLADVAFTKFAETAIGNYGFEGRTTGCLTGACPYPSQWAGTYVDLSTEEPWLFDRATAFYKLYAKTGDVRWRDHAVMLASTYYGQIVMTGSTRGIFKLSSYDHDLKYSYTDPAVWYEAMTGDQRFRPQVQAIYDASLREWQTGYSAGMSFWTERHHAYALGAALGYYAIFGSPEALARARQLFETVNTMAASTGAPVHTVEQHEGDPGDARLMVSPWMSAFLVEYIATYGRLSGDARVNQYLSRYADFIVANCLYDGGVESSELAGELMPSYLCGVGTAYEDERGWGDREHAIDVSGVLAHGIAAKLALGQDVTATLAAYNGLQVTAQRVFAYWTRTEPTLPKYREAPPRKFSWWFGSTYDNTALVQ